MFVCISLFYLGSVRKNYYWYCFLIIGQKVFLSPGVLSLRTFCPAVRFVSTDVLSLRMFCLYGCFVSTDVLSHGRYVSGCFVSRRFVSGCFVPTDVFSPDVLSGHQCNDLFSNIEVLNFAMF